MTKRRDRNRTARRRKRVYIWHWTDSTEEQYRAALADQILQTITKGEPPCWSTTNAKSSTISP